MVRGGERLLLPGQFENRRVEVEAVGEDADPFGMKGGTAVQLNKTPPGDIDSLTTESSLREAADPREIQQNRSKEARAADRAKDAPITTDPLEWASDPGATDFPGVDTGPVFRESEGEDFDSDAFLNDLL